MEKKTFIENQFEFIRACPGEPATEDDDEEGEMKCGADEMSTEMTQNFGKAGPVQFAVRLKF